MSRRASSDDVSVILYMMPFIVSGIYGIYLGIVDRAAYLLSPTVYLTVTRDPYIFLVGSVSVMLAVVLEISSTSPATRSGKLTTVGETLQMIALASFVLSIICALYANGFLSVSGAGTDFMVGRYSFIFPIAMVLLSYLLTAKVKVSAIGTPTVLGMVALILVPVSLYEVGKRNLDAGHVVSLGLLVVGLALLLTPSILAQRKEGTPSAEA